MIKYISLSRVLTLCFSFAFALNIFAASAAHAEQNPVITGNGAKIVGGRPVTESEFYGTVAIIDPSSYEDFDYTVAESQYCSGTLISPKVVVTAAHCVEWFEPREVKDNAMIAAGWLNDSPEGKENLQTAHVRKVIVHENYGPDSSTIPEDVICISPWGPNPTWEECERFSDPFVQPWNDIALLFLDEAITVVTPMPMLAPIAFSGPGSIPVQASGYGNTFDGECPQGPTPEKNYGCLQIGDMKLEGLRESEVMVGPLSSPNSQSYVCYGDSGGPLYFSINGERVLMGITSRARADKSIEAIEGCTSGDIFTYAPAFLDWISSKLESSDLAIEIENGQAHVIETGAKAESLDGCSFGTNDNSHIAIGWAAMLIGIALWLRRARRRHVVRNAGAYI